jgi:HSP20 family protein
MLHRVRGLPLRVDPGGRSAAVQRTTGVARLQDPTRAHRLEGHDADARPATHAIGDRLPAYFCSGALRLVTRPTQVIGSRHVTGGSHGFADATWRWRPGATPARLGRLGSLWQLENMWSEMGRLLEQAAAPSGTAPWLPVAEEEESEDAYIVRAELPGIPAENVDIELEGNELSITGEISEERRGKVLSRRTGRFSYRTSLPGGADSENIDADLTDGILAVRILKAEEGSAARSRSVVAARSGARRRSRTGLGRWSIPSLRLRVLDLVRLGPGGSAPAAELLDQYAFFRDGHASIEADVYMPTHGDRSSFLRCGQILGGIVPHGGHMSLPAPMTQVTPGTPCIRPRTAPASPGPGLTFRFMRTQAGPLPPLLPTSPTV